MKNITRSIDENRFVAFYGFLDPDESVTQKVTMPRASIEAVISDIADIQQRDVKICFVQIVDLANLRPVGNSQTTPAWVRPAE